VSAATGGGLVATRGGFKFRGPAVGGGTLNVRLRSKDGRRFKVAVTASGLDAAGSPAPVGTTTLRMGDDCFAETLPCTTSGGGQSVVCKPPR
jgi:hypothetical protein